MIISHKVPIAHHFVYYIGLLLINLIIMHVIGFLTLDSFATFNSQVGGIIISILLPTVIIKFTPEMGRIERFLKFGLGNIIYIILVLIQVEIQHAITCFILPCLLFYLVLLYFPEFFSPGLKKA